LVRDVPAATQVEGEASNLRRVAVARNHNGKLLPKQGDVPSVKRNVRPTTMMIVRKSCSLPLKIDQTIHARLMSQ